MALKTEDIEDLDISQLVGINQLNLEDEFATAPRYFYLFSSLSVEAEDLYDQHTLEMEIYENQLAKKIKQVNADMPNRKKSDDLTQTDIKRLFHQNEEWVTMRKRQLELQKNWKMMEKAAKSFEIKTRMLSSLNRRDLFKVGQGM